jgi:hypothetical protein
VSLRLHLRLRAGNKILVNEKMIRHFAAVSSLLLLVVTLSGQTPAVPETSPGNWSAVVNGVRGRLIVTPVPDPRGAQFQLEFELQNMTNNAEPIDIWWGNWNDMLRFALEDESGAPVISGVEPGGNQMIIAPFWLKLIRQGSMRAIVSTAGFEYLQAPERLLLRPTVFQGWFLPLPRTSKLYLSAVFTPPKSREKTRSQWVGPLSLPRVALP